MSHVVLVAVVLQFELLLFDKGGVCFFKVVDFNIKSIDAALKLRDLTLSSMNSSLAVITVLRSGI